MSCKSPVKRVGGKFLLAPHIISLFPPHKIYVEVFGGGAHVLCRKPHLAEDGTPIREVYNDRLGELVNFFRAVRSPQARGLMMDYLAMVPYSRRQFCLWRDQIGTEKWEALPKWIRAARWFAVLRMAYCARMKGASWSAGHTATQWRPSAFRSATLALEALSERFRLVQVDDLDYSLCIERYDSPDTLFYLDPPYVGTEFYYAKCTFGLPEHRALAAQLAAIAGKAAVSYQAHPLVDELYPAPHWRRVSWEIYRPSSRPKSGRPKHAEELLLMNYDPPTS